MIRNVWGDNDKVFGPFTYSSSEFNSYGVECNGKSYTRADNTRFNHCCLRLFFGKRVIIMSLPNIAKPKMILEKGYDQSLHETWYPTCYGIRAWDGMYQISYGIRTDDSNSCKTITKSIPWLVWSYIRTSYFSVDGDCVGIEYGYNTDSEISIPTPIKFFFLDYDGELNVAKCLILEREWQRGERLWRWLKYITKPLIRKELDIQYSREVGKKKRSWKGGTTGTGIEFLSGESYESAFQRHCEANSLTYLKHLSDMIEQ